MIISTAGLPARENKSEQTSPSSASQKNQHATLDRRPQQLPSEAKSSAEHAPTRQRTTSQSPLHTRPGVPKFISVGQRVRFSTEVAAVRIPSVEDLSAASRRQLWWQRKDYAEFRANYAKFVRSPSAEDDPDWDAGHSELLPCAPPVIEVPSNYQHVVSVDKPTVEGVLIVSASPASAPAASCEDNRIINDGSKDPRNARVLKKGGLNLASNGHGVNGAPTYVHDPVGKWGHFERYNQNAFGRSVDHLTHNQLGQMHGGQTPKHDYRVPVIAVGPVARGGGGVAVDPRHLRPNMYNHGNPHWYANDGGISGVRHGPPRFGYGGDVASYLAAARHQQQQQRQHQHQRACRVEGPRLTMQVPNANSQFSMWRSQMVCTPLPHHGRNG